MLGFFPKPYPDELFFSVIARYIDSLHVNSISTLNHILFGYRSSNYFPVTGVPARLNVFVEQLPPGANLSVESLIQNNTLMPYYTPFMFTKRRHTLQNKQIYAIVQLPGIPKLQYCPLCAKEDRLSFGNPYWHRLHQAPGVSICTKHKCFLVTTSLHSHGLIKYQTLAQYLKEKTASIPIFIDPKNRKHNILFDIAVNTQWILSNQLNIEDINEFRNKIRSLFDFGPWVTNSTGHQFKFQEFVRTLIMYYSNDLLGIINCPLDNDCHKPDWLLMLMQKNIKTLVIHPLRFILVLLYLGHSVESFFKSNKLNNNPFGTGPWQCLNPASVHFNEFTITNIKTWHRFNKKNRKGLIGIFECPLCGFTYKHNALNNSIKVQDYGFIWEERLLTCACDPERSWNSIANELGVEWSTAQRRLKQLKSTLNIGNLKDISPGAIDRVELKNTIEHKKFEYRKLWSETRMQYPQATRYELLKLIEKCYSWLSKYDRAWLEMNKPPALKGGKKVDWVSRDIELLVLSKKIVQDILEQTDPPIKLTRLAIIKKFPFPLKIRNYVNLPSTIKYIDSVIESENDFISRSVTCFTKQFTKNGTIPSQIDYISKLRASTKLKVIVLSQINTLISEQLLLSANPFYPQ
ncbi:MAG: hypothetical protein HPY50_04265 [Firmicutes bacterium]|nr:hypothetical protein [Bacillota bacterium]